MFLPTAPITASPGMTSSGLVLWLLHWTHVAVEKAVAWVNTLFLHGSNLVNFVTF